MSREDRYTHTEQDAAEYERVVHGDDYDHPRAQVDPSEYADLVDPIYIPRGAACPECRHAVADHDDYGCSALDGYADRYGGEPCGCELSQSDIAEIDEGERLGDRDREEPDGR